MKVCILSMQHVQNYGSLLQSYSLKKKCEKLGHDIEFIDIKKIDGDFNLFENKYQSFSYEISSDKGILSKIKKIDKYLLNRVHCKLLLSAQSSVFCDFRKEFLLINKNYENKYDMCVIGSDEVFNCMAETPWGFTSQLFGNVEQADKVITYAASCGSTTYSDLPDSVKNRLRETFKNVSAISVRDENTAEFVEKLTDRKIFQHLDPVLVGDFDEEIEQANDIQNLPEKFCVIYSYYNRIHKKEEINAIKSFCKLNGMKIVTVGAPQMWVKDHFVLTPFEMLKVFQKAQFVITDTFHGTIFSVRYSNKFAVMLRDSNRNKLFDLVCRLDIKEHLIENMNQLQKAYVVKKDTIKLEKILNKERQNTKNYLKENIGYGKFYE